MARSPLLPIRHPDQDFFICDLGDVIPKSDIASMENPLFTLSTKPDKKLRRYSNNGYTVKIAPSYYGHATIHDKDILIYCISKLMKAVNLAIDEAKICDDDAASYIAPSRTVRFKAHDLLVTTNRDTSGHGYMLLKNALDRLAGTRITTNIKTAATEITEGFGLIDSFRVVHENPTTKRMIEVELTISKWLYNAITHQEVLTINRDYFRLRKPLERRIYEIARKHCGTKKQWKIGIKKLHNKVGSSGNVRLFKVALKKLIETNHLPDYQIYLDGDVVVIGYKGKLLLINDDVDDRPRLQDPEIYDKARKILKRQFEVYEIKSDWYRFWEASGKPPISNPDGAFLNFCKKRMELVQK